MTNGPQTAVPSVEADRWARRRRVLIPALIALTSCLGAVGAWRASAASGAATSAERGAFANTVAAEQQRAYVEAAVGSVEMTYARRAALREAAAALRLQATETTGEEAARLNALAGAWEYLASQFIVDADALAPDGSLDLEAVREVEWALAAGQWDLDPGPEMAEAGGLRAKSERLVGLTALLITAALFLTMAQVSRQFRAAALFWTGGLAVLAVSTALLVVVEAL